MAKVIVNVERYKGTYDLDPEVPMTALDWSWIKKISGYLPLTVDAGFEGDDPELYVALAVIALHRAGKVRPNEAVAAAALLMTGDYGTSIVMDFSDENEKEALADEEQADVGEE